MGRMIVAFLFVAALMLVGIAVRARFAFMRWLFIPSSVIAGLIGLAIIQCGLRYFDAPPPAVQEVTVQSKEPDVHKPPADAVSAVDYFARLRKTLKSWPGFLIAVVFAGMLIQRGPTATRESFHRVGRQGLMVWVIVLGQTTVGLLATWLIVQPLVSQPKIPNSFGMLIETGFAGGHGTAAAMSEVYKHPLINLPVGADLGILMATCGLVYGLISGVVLINLGVRMGWLGESVSVTQTMKTDADHPKPIGYAKIHNDVVDPLFLQVLWLAMAMALGLMMQACVLQVAAWIDGPPEVVAEAVEGAQQQLSKRLKAASVMDFPLFIYTLFGGLFVRKVLSAIGQASLVDRETINRLTSSAMDILVVAAISSLNLIAVAKMLVPFSILLVVGGIWCAVCLLLLSRMILPEEYWFQLGLINYGMSTGTTATGFVLLRMVDPEIQSGAAEDYALAAPLSAPFIGGGILTVGLPLIVLERVPIAIPAILLVAVIGALIVAGQRWKQATEVRESA